MFKIAIVAGEASGDLIGAKLLRALGRQTQFEAAGVGGVQMIEAGFKSIFPIDELSIVGFIEVLPKIFTIYKRIKQTVNFLCDYKPDILITIDSPGFNFRLVKSLRELKVSFPILHYVAPTVWAYNPERVFIVAKLYDHLLTILPFEKEYFSKAEIPVTYVGHPVFEDILPYDSKSHIKAKHGYSEDDKVVAISPGSRDCEIKSHMPTLMKSIKQLILEPNGEKFALLTLPHLYGLCCKFIEEFSLARHIKVVVDQDAKKEIMYCSDAALVKSGTVAIEFARMKVPIVVFYKISFLSYLILRMKIKIKYVNIINIMANQSIIPELLQQQFHELLLCGELKNILQGNGLKQVECIAPYLQKLHTYEAATPGEAAAAVVLQYMNKAYIKPF